MLKQLFGQNKYIMEQQTLQIQGGKPLNGTVTVSGAKNEATKLMVASALMHKPVLLENVPDIGDVEITAELLRGIGASVAYNPKSQTMRIDATSLKSHHAIYEEVARGNRLSILLAGPLLHHFGEATVQKPGGCKIGERPLDLHIYYLRKMGVAIDEDDTLIHLKGKLRGAIIEFPYKSVGATEGVLLASVYATGTTVIKNPANEPEIAEQIKFLQRAGALIRYDANGNILVEGSTVPLAVTHPIRIMGDRVEAISYASAAAATDGKVAIAGIQQHQIITAVTALRRAGVHVEFDGQHMIVSRQGDLQALKLETDPHPAFATDFQQVFVVLLSQSTGTSFVHETVFDNRFNYLKQLNNLGGNFEVLRECKPFLSCRFSGLHEHTAKVSGPVAFHGGAAEITDLRAAFALTIAGLLSKHPTHLANAHHLLRGYDHPIEKLRALGAEISLI